MPDERLTRQELSWLLAQEAKSAARALRDGVSQLLEPKLESPDPSALPAVELTIDALDGALAALGESPSQVPSRRGRIDLASLVGLVAPRARLAFEPGAGTEVIGDESELRRVLHVLLSQTSDPGDETATATPDVQIRREGDLVLISVALGPDQSANAELERRWLHRMAVRVGGRFELARGEQHLYLPAEDASARAEVDELRRELEQAKQLGEAYARELAEVFTSHSEPPTIHDTEPPRPPESGRFELLQGIAAAMVRRLRPMIEGIEADLEVVRSLVGDAPAVVAIGQRSANTRELVGELTRLASCVAEESPGELDLGALVAEVAERAESRAARHAVRIAPLVGDTKPTLVHAPRGVVTLLVRSLLDHAIAATPRDGTVEARVRATPDGVELLVTDGGTSVPVRAREDLVRHRIDPTSVGRPAGVWLVIADTTAGLLDAALDLADGPAGGLGVRVRFLTPVEVR